MVNIIKAKREKLANEVADLKSQLVEKERKLEVYDEVLEEVVTEENAAEEKRCENASCEVVCETQNII